LSSVKTRHASIAQSRHAFIGAGIYTVPEASRLTGVFAARIRRWVKGYTYVVGDKVLASRPVVHSQLQPLDGVIALGFLDLIEVRFIDAFRRSGVSWKSIRLAYDRARELIGSEHPFSTKIFRSDGRRIFAEIVQQSSRSPSPTKRHGSRSSRIKGLLPVAWSPMYPSRPVAFGPSDKVLAKSPAPRYHGWRASRRLCQIKT
jgi:hypothetical protein